MLKGYIYKYWGKWDTCRSISIRYLWSVIVLFGQRFGNYQQQPCLLGLKVNQSQIGIPFIFVPALLLPNKVQQSTPTGQSWICRYEERRVYMYIYMHAYHCQLLLWNELCCSNEFSEENQEEIPKVKENPVKYIGFSWWMPVIRKALKVLCDLLSSSI